MANSKLKALVAQLAIEQPDSNVGLFIKLTDRDNVDAAFNALLDNGFTVDVNMNMGEYFFSFKNIQALTNAKAIIDPLLDLSKENT